jgi:hypothetical protein
MNTLAKDLSRKNLRSQTWQQIGGAGSGIMFSKICKAMHANDLFIAETSVPNLNVWFEIGYAIAIGRDPILLVDSNRKSQDRPSILPTIYQCYYQRIDQVWPELNKLLAERESTFLPNRVSSLLVPVDLLDERDGVVYVIPAWQDDAFKNVTKQLETAKQDEKIVAFHPLIRLILFLTISYLKPERSPKQKQSLV